jgi:hypothetical protein
VDWIELLYVTETSFLFGRGEGSGVINKRDGWEEFGHDGRNAKQSTARQGRARKARVTKGR